MQRSPEVEAALADISASSDPEQMRSLIRQASSAALHFQPAPGEWSIVEILRHLGDTEEMRQWRFDRMLAEDNPILDRITPQPGDRDSEDSEVLLNRYAQLRLRAVERLGALTDEQWRRVGTQLPDPQVQRTVPSPTSVLAESQKINRHSGRHLEQIQANLTAFERSAAAKQ
jgi:hypothetical protein